MDIPDRGCIGAAAAAVCGLLTAFFYACECAAVEMSDPRLKKLAADGMCSLEAMCALMSEEKKDMLDKVTFKGDELRKFFPKSYTPKQMQETIIKLLTQWQKKRERDMSL